MPQKIAQPQPPSKNAGISLKSKMLGLFTYLLESHI